MLLKIICIIFITLLVGCAPKFHSFEKEWKNNMCYKRILFGKTRTIDAGPWLKDFKTSKNKCK